ncbi:[FeFe] hydrogenase H-cluster radical SAM maturase HydE [Ferrimonas sediminicola]|uniref:[FeFe] hydrogenase H-cluster radical SAM maturase HydE n=1 Tax=Ferrimonas sediminicola TaxID=2569538 RepID=A0A4U1BFM8_9GAMM|nr:[FeFe] hydrogenase H-cluster radical SAM maturase HydE [Ferrimonas sediminicola]TKB49927.1 [FeFe] hydrogenase H-cluster radical SAM maturase HydE [Ferrimonas sediminicola]
MSPVIAPESLFSERQILELLGGGDDDWLFSRARLATQLAFGDQVFMRGIVEFSNHCRNDCHYCGLRSGNRELGRYRLSQAQILEAVDQAAAFGMGTLVLQSGDDNKYRCDDISQLIHQIKAKHKLAITLSLGDRSLEELAQWRQAGADRYLLKMETFDRRLFAESRPRANFDERLERLRGIQALGYQTGCGIITDLPGMTDEILARDIIQLTRLKLDMIACGPFVAHPQTPMSLSGNGSVLKSHRVSAILRLMNPGANIPATSSLEALEPGARALALLRGCNVVMPSFTPQNVFSQYDIYPGKNAAKAFLRERLEVIRNQIRQHGLEPSSARGDARSH